MQIDFLANVFLVLYSIVVLYLFIGTIRAKKLIKNTAFKYITILIPAKDEEENIADCLLAISKQNYPIEYFEVLLINDQSEDRTFEIAESMKKVVNNLRILNLDENYQPDLEGKSRVIDYGIGMAKYDIILMTDADCMPNPDWLKSHASFYDKKTGMVAGITVLDEEYGRSKLFSILQSIDWIFLLGAGAASSGFNNHISCIGSNISFRKDAYNEVGTYKKLRFSITEDLLLFKTIAKETKWRVVFPMLSSILNFSKPMSGFKEYYQQRKRWVMGSKDLNFVGSCLLSSAIMAHILAILTVFYGMYHIFAVFLLDYFIVSVFLFNLNQKKYSKYLIVYLGFYVINIFMLIYVTFFDRTVVWKNRRYNRKGRI